MVLGGGDLGVWNGAVNLDPVGSIGEVLGLMMWFVVEFWRLCCGQWKFLEPGVVEI